ncbi:MAG: DNA polymerase III subunit gamma/tau, partial [Rhodocyclaceae bacterium]|nr:DNA polymerase III subunit gamma/tau [Rhodocyclaceae bacterium]
MSYQVLARKWRPKSFDTLVGQEHVVRALTHALDQQRLHHAYLFTGTRGVGKTTLARILAKALNCETGITSKPCGVCGACLEIDSGRFIDYVEMDAASNRGVEDMAALLEKAAYAPNSGRYKVYMIDEVHQLSGHAFNAMLKTLEEPPEHVKFILATTDPQKLPITVLSRCLQFNLKRLPVSLIREQLAKVLDQEGLAFELGGIGEIARAADGSMRDGLSLLDQAIAFSGGAKLERAAIEDMLGTSGRQVLYALIGAVAARNGRALLQGIQQLDARAP